MLASTVIFHMCAVILWICFILILSVRSTNWKFGWAAFEQQRKYRPDWDTHHKSTFLDCCCSWKVRMLRFLGRTGFLILFHLFAFFSPIACVDLGFFMYLPILSDFLESGYSRNDEHMKSLTHLSHTQNNSLTSNLILGADKIVKVTLVKWMLQTSRWGMALTFSLARNLGLIVLFVFA